MLISLFIYLCIMRITCVPLCVCVNFDSSYKSERMIYPNDLDSVIQSELIS